MISSLGTMRGWLVPFGTILLAQVGKGKGAAVDTTPFMLQLGIWGGALLLIIVVTSFIVRKLRGSATGNRQNANELLAKFQEMRQEGDINDAEFRNIKAVLGNQIRSDAKSGKNTP